MLLGPSELANYDKDGFLIIRNLFSEEEVSILRKEATRIAKVDSECVIREGTSKTPKIMLRLTRHKKVSSDTLPHRPSGNNSLFSGNITHQRDFQIQQLLYLFCRSF